MNHYLNSLADLLEDRDTRENIIEHLRRCAENNSNNMIISIDDSNIVVVTENYLNELGLDIEVVDD